ncbi:MAG: hypothetical protein HY265_06250 [Deltaproteobacteria bacterium]|nr:hypothetical protein [Deltaproteobacteria bacterium]MBI3755742.1 hypothetical protein [Deltaproteobacteria bacterium]
MELIVCDTGPILHLREAKLLKLLQKQVRFISPRGFMQDYEKYISENERRGINAFAEEVKKVA